MIKWHVFSLQILALLLSHMLKLTEKDSTPSPSPESSADSIEEPPASTAASSGSSSTADAPESDSAEETKEGSEAPGAPEERRAHEFLFQKMGRLLDKISTRVKTDAQLWEVYAEYFDAVGDLEKVRALPRLAHFV